MDARYYSLMHGPELKMVPGAQEGLANLMGTSATIHMGNHTIGDLNQSYAFGVDAFGFGDFLPSDDGTGGVTVGLPTSAGEVGGIIGGIAGGLAGGAASGKPTSVSSLLGIDTSNLLGNAMVGLLALLLIGLGIYILFGKQITEVVVDAGKAAA